jgi:two-component system phosphate regulon sensor histidine kinase PhoR
MIRPQRYFPWKIARRLYFSQLSFVFVALMLTGYSLRYYAYAEFSKSTDIAVALAHFDKYLTQLFFTILGFAALYLLFVVRFYSRPLARLLQRARELRRLDAPIEAFEAEADEGIEEPGEWSDLERALTRIHKDLRLKTEDLFREREELTALIGALSDGILAVDARENALFYNPQFALMFRVIKMQEKSLRLGEMIRVPEVLDGYRDVLQSGEMKVITASFNAGESEFTRHYSIAIAPLRGTGPESVGGAIAVFHDVTELKAAEQIRIEFVANASHELRTPITNIKGYVETVRDDVKNKRFESVPQFFEIISKNVDRLTFLVNDLLDLSTLESGSELRKSIVATREVTEATLRAVEAKRSARNQEIHTHFETDTVLADPHRVEQVLINLVSNAIKYIPENRRIDIYWEPQGEATVLRVKDNGLGISADHQHRLFERFYRVDTGRSREQGGTGLGLAIVKHIMLKHGGSVRLNSRAGEGAEFVCLFP